MFNMQVLEGDPVRITVLGFGNVGATIGYLLLHSTTHRLALNFMEPSPAKAGKLLDVLHSWPLRPDHLVSINDVEAFRNAQIVVHTAGSNRKIVGSRMEVAAENIQLTERIFQDIQFTGTPHVLVATNPVDVIAFHTARVTGLPPDHVYGMGTHLDSMRLAWCIARQLQRPVSGIEAWVLGEHGETQVPIWSRTRVEGVPVHEIHDLVPHLKDLAARTRNAAREIKQTQDATYYGVSASAVRMIRAIVQDMDSVLPVSVRVSGEWNTRYRIPAVWMSLPACIRSGKVMVLENFRLENEEMEALRESASYLVPFTLGRDG